MHFGFKQLVTLNATFVFSHEFVEFSKELLPFTADYLMAMENKELKAITLLLAALLVVLFRFLLRNPLDMSNSYRMSSASIRTNDSVGSYGGVTAHPVELGDGSIQVCDDGNSCEFIISSVHRMDWMGICGGSFSFFCIKISTRVTK